MADFVKVASGAKAVKREGGYPQAKVTGTSELGPPVLNDGRGPQLAAKMSKQTLGQPGLAWVWAWWAGEGQEQPERKGGLSRGRLGCLPGASSTAWPLKN